MKRHPPLPGGKDLKGMAQVVSRIIEEDIAQSTAENNTGNDRQVQVIHVPDQLIPFIQPGLVADQQVGRQETKDIHQSVPAHL